MLKTLGGLLGKEKIFKRGKFGVWWVYQLCNIMKITLT